MAELKYYVIETKEQYYEYCKILEELVFSEDESKEREIDLLTVLIEKWDKEHTVLNDLDPIDLLKYLMEENQLKAKDLVGILDLSKGTVSKILSRQCGLSKETIRRLSAHFKLNQEAFNREYPLVNVNELNLKDAAVMNTKKEIRVV